MQGHKALCVSGGVFEIAEGPDDAPGAGVYPEFHQPRRSRSHAQAFDPGEAEQLGLVDDNSQGPGVA